MPQTANNSAPSRYQSKSRTPMRPLVTIEPPLSKRSLVSLSKTADPSQVKNNTNSKLTQYSINSGAPIKHNPHLQQHSRHSTGSTSPSNTSKHVFNNPKGGGGWAKPLLPAKFTWAQATYPLLISHEELPRLTPPVPSAPHLRLCRHLLRRQRQGA